jgi:hypothetical protein
LETPPSASADCGHGFVSILAIGNETVVVETVRNIQTIVVVAILERSLPPASQTISE